VYTESLPGLCEREPVGTRSYLLTDEITSMFVPVTEITQP
jgi:hypothetical protein